MPHLQVWLRVPELLKQFRVQIWLGGQHRGRRLKCDERRPGCRRCAALKVECGGYQNYNSAQSNQERAVVPRTASADLEEILILPLHHFPQDMKYASQQEYQYFNHFAENTGLQLWLNFTPRLWRRLLEQCSSIEPSLRHLIISVGALGKLSVLEAPEDSQLVFARTLSCKCRMIFNDKNA